MTVKAIAVDESGTHHLVIGLNRENVESILRGDVFTLPRGYLVGLSEDSDGVIMFAETDDDIRMRFPPALRPV